MSRPSSRRSMSLGGLLVACAVVCCSAPLLILVVPGLALLIGGAVGAIEAGLIGAIVLGVLTWIGVLAWRRRHNTCARGAE